ncbi:acid-resistance protein [Bordetella hinzii]|uniref:acid-activated periplasmic chaperone HdeA n=1 Tax=Bordetella hinzii TaxID=103855 RepID=UPI0013EFCC4F|nr:acid-activated periplasmic chaperone HdeA [Bordetella hinzii]QII84016.1 acid-resistance protein [Bordetella hinzii]QWF40136.1 acid-resistance protein [Bordetella hinzii]QWF44683.1 acid-resistance protein [Bordetella hinzii]QWF49220.1 acid-resistance protein [Bordetella hinzii]QWF53756.1 acid-resistance protein [Bordetella hinzii]
MRKSIIVLAMACAALASTSASAKEASKHASATSTQKALPLWLCGDYVGLDESYRPIALGFAEAFGRNGKPESDVLDVEGIAKLTPVLLTYCQENPKIALRDALAQVKK